MRALIEMSERNTWRVWEPILGSCFVPNNGGRSEEDDTARFNASIGVRGLTGNPLSNLLHVLEIIQNWVIANLDPFWPDEYAPLDFRFLAPIPGGPNTSIVLADWFIQLDAYPSTDTRDLFDFAHVLDLSPSGVVFADPASLPDGDPTGFDFLSNGGNLGLLKAGSIGVEAAELLSLLPGKDRVRLLLILFLRQHIFFDTSRAREIGSR